MWHTGRVTTMWSEERSCRRNYRRKDIIRFPRSHSSHRLLHPLRSAAAPNFGFFGRKSQAAITTGCECEFHSCASVETGSGDTGISGTAGEAVLRDCYAPSAASGECPANCSGTAVLWQWQSSSACSRLQPLFIHSLKLRCVSSCSSSPLRPRSCAAARTTNTATASASNSRIRKRAGTSISEWSSRSADATHAGNLVFLCTLPSCTRGCLRDDGRRRRNRSERLGFH
jgi:hypothetical protein